MLSTVLGLVDVSERLSKGLKVDVLWIEGKSVPVVNGSFKKGDGVSVVIECAYQRPGEQQHTLKVISAKGSDNNVIEIDGVKREPISIKVAPDLDGIHGDIEATVKFKDPGPNGGNRLIVVSSEKVF